MARNRPSLCPWCGSILVSVYAQRPKSVAIQLGMEAKDRSYRQILNYAFCYKCQKILTFEVKVVK